MSMVKVTDEGLFPVSREKVWQLIEAHGKDLQGIHPNVKSVKPLDKEMTTFEQTREVNGQTVRMVIKVTPSHPDKLTLEFLEGPMTGKIVNTYTEVSGGTKVVSECDMKSQMMDDKQLEGAVRQTLNSGFDDDLRYLNTKMK
jgi:hypothetical protein